MKNISDLTSLEKEQLTERLARRFAQIKGFEITRQDRLWESRNPKILQLMKLADSALVEVEQFLKHNSN